MKIVVLHGQNHKGSTYHITELFISKIRDEETKVQAFQLAKQEPCVGCYKCFIKGEENCPHFEVVHPIICAIEEADLVILESPCYCMGMSGQLKVFLDHMGYRWMSHRPHEKMFRKVGLTISTAAGAGANKVTKDLKQQLFYWGVPITYRYGLNIGAMSWAEVSEKKRQSIEKDVQKFAKKVSNQLGKTKVTIPSRVMFYLMRINQKNNTWNETDKGHWESKGWLEKKRPWL